jgi:hypothetical protein
MWTLQSRPQAFELVGLAYFLGGKVMPKYRKKPVVIEAIKFDGHNTDEVEKFVGKRLHQQSTGGIAGRPIWSVFIETLEGNMKADAGDWIIKGVKGEFYPCKPDIFEATYEAVTP